MNIKTRIAKGNHRPIYLKGLKCAWCGVVKLLRPSQVKKRKYCSRDCEHKSLTKYTNYFCLNCGNPNSSGRRKFCSALCAKTSAYNPNWRGGITSEHRALRNSNRYKEWRTAVFERDNYTCLLCGQVGGNLQADHRYPWALFPELRFDVDNGQTLCDWCHALKPKNFGSIEKFMEYKHTLLGLAI